MRIDDPYELCVDMTKEHDIVFCGSAVALASLPHGPSPGDYDLFTPNLLVLGEVVSDLTRRGFELDEKSQKMMRRWRRFGTKWHTNSVRLDCDGVQINVVFKRERNVPLVDGLDVTGSFDFGVLLQWWERGAFFDLREALLRPSEEALGLVFDIDRLPLIGRRTVDVESGMFTFFSAIKMAERYVKYTDYMFNLDRVVEIMVPGYLTAAEYKLQLMGTPAELEQYAVEAQIMGAIAELIDVGDIDQLRKGLAELDSESQLDTLLKEVS